MRGTVFGCALLVAATTARSARADTDKGAADILFRQGQEALKAGRVVEACAALKGSYQLDPALGTLINMGYCHEQEGLTATALAELTRAAHDPKLDPERAAFVAERLRELTARAFRVRFTSASNRTVSEVRIDGVAVAVGSDSTVALDPGEHRITVVLVYRSGPWEWKVTAPKEPGLQTLALPEPIRTLEPPPGPAAPGATSSVAPPQTPPETTPARPGSSGRLVGELSSLGVGVVAAGIGSYFGVHTISLKSSADRACGSSEHCGDTVRADAANQDVTRARSSATISTVAFGVALAGVVTAACLLLSKPRAASVASGAHPSMGAVSFTPYGVALSFDRP